MGGLDYQLQEEEFARHFARFGPVRECQIVRDPNTNASRGFGFVTFHEEAVAQDLINNVHVTDMNGRKVDLRSAEPKLNDKPNLINKATPSSNRQSYSGSQQQRGGRDEDRRGYRDGAKGRYGGAGHHRDNNG